MKKQLLILILLLFSKQSFSIISIEFDRSMNVNSKEYKKKYSLTHRKKTIQKFKDLYEKNNFEKIIPAHQPKIPLIIHHIWVGTKQRPETLNYCMESWKKHHPNWQHILWTDTEVKTLNLYNQDLYDAATDPREKADILRYELLYTFGGLYVDCDFECLQNFDDLHYRYDVYVGISPNNVEEVVTNALIGCTPSNPFMLKVIQEQKNITNKHWAHRSGVYYFSNQCIKYLANEPGITIAFPLSFFYPLPFNFDKNRSLQFYVKPETMALHYWAKSQGDTLKPLKKGA